MESFRIESVCGGCSIEFFGRVPEDESAPIDGYWVRLTGPGLSVALAVETGYGRTHPVPMLAEMAERWRGWPDRIEWSSLYGELILRGSQNRVGHVSIAVELRSGWGDRDWALQSTIETEAGQLERIARDAARFFGES